MAQPYNGVGRIELNTNENSFSGDFVFYGNEDTFSVEVYYLGTLVFKGEAKDGQTNYFYMGNFYKEGDLYAAFIPIKFYRLKSILIDAVKGKQINFVESGMFFKSEKKDMTIILNIEDTEKGTIKIILEK